MATVGSQTQSSLDIPPGQLPRGKGSHTKRPLTEMGLREVSSDPGVQGRGPGQECGLGGPEGLAKCLLSLVDLDRGRHWVSLFTHPTG